MIAAGFVTAPADAPKEVSPVHDRFDALWWDIYDHLHDPIYSIRRGLDHAGLEQIDEIGFEELEKAATLPGSLQSVLALPDRAQEKIDEGAPPEPIFVNTVDAISWLAAARKSQLRKVPMDWQSNSWDI